MKVAVSDFQPPERTRVTFRIEVSSEFNISSYVAKQQANRFLAMNVGNLLYAGEPELLLGQKLQWRVPVLYALPKVGKLGKVGEVLVNVDTGDVTFAEMTTQEDIERNVEALYHSAALPAGEEL